MQVVDSVPISFVPFLSIIFSALWTEAKVLGLTFKTKKTYPPVGSAAGTLDHVVPEALGALWRNECAEEWIQSVLIDEPVDCMGMVQR